MAHRGSERPGETCSHPRPENTVAADLWDFHRLLQSRESGLLAAMVVPFWVFDRSYPKSRGMVAKAY